MGKDWIPQTARETSRLIAGDISPVGWKIHLFQFVDDFRVNPENEMVCEPPLVELAPRQKALLAATTWALCDEMGVYTPSWVFATPALDVPWFVAGVENLVATALVECPVWFRQKNVWVLGNFLCRA